jgi:Fe-S-cluster containining protein
MSERDEDLESGLRFLHVLGMQTKLDVSDVTARLLALVEELVARGHVSLRSLDDRIAKAREEEGRRIEKQATVAVGPSVDKYTLQSPAIPCAELVSICKARCCRLDFPLSFQDLDEGVVRWNYGRPYHIRKGDDGRCVHSVAETGACGVYAQRPAICRTYDCRNDTRVWLDYEKRIPAPDDAIPLVKIRKRETSVPGGAG